MYLFCKMPRWTQLKPNTLRICAAWLNLQTRGKHSWEACVPHYTHTDTHTLAGRYWDSNKTTRAPTSRQRVVRGYRLFWCITTKDKTDENGRASTLWTLNPNQMCEKYSYPYSTSDTNSCIQYLAEVAQVIIIRQTTSLTYFYRGVSQTQSERSWMQNFKYNLSTNSESDAAWNHKKHSVSSFRTKEKCFFPTTVHHLIDFWNLLSK